MSGRYRSESKVIEILDRLFESRKRSILLSLGAAGIVYLMMLVLGHQEYLFTAILRPPVMGLLSFVSAFLTLGVMLALPFISPKLMDIVEGAVVIAAVVLVALGAANMWFAVFADVGVAFLAILNAMRAMKVSE